MGLWNVSGICWCPQCRKNVLTVKTVSKKFLGTEFIAEQCVVCNLILNLEKTINVKADNKKPKKKRRK